MSDAPDDLDDHLATLVRLRGTGADVYNQALQSARVAVAKVILAEAHRLAALSKRGAAKVIPFPLRTRGSPSGPPKNGGVDP